MTNCLTKLKQNKGKLKIEITSFPDLKSYLHFFNSGRKRTFPQVLFSIFAFPNNFFQTKDRRKINERNGEKKEEKFKKEINSFRMTC